jgi:preprotein translocase subunit SecE
MAVPETTGAEEEKGFSITEFLSETKVELKKVTWPTKQELIANTIVVIIAVCLCAGLIWIIDTIFSVLFRIILR